MVGYIVSLWPQQTRSFIGGALLWMVSPATNFITAFACGLLGTIYFAIYGKDLGTDVQRMDDR
ncbi:MAG: hypothetical protein ABIJ53_09805 [Verrucomicrobiota bacterium]